MLCYFSTSKLYGLILQNGTRFLEPPSECENPLGARTTRANVAQALGFSYLATTGF